MVKRLLTLFLLAAMVMLCMSFTSVYADHNAMGTYNWGAYANPQNQYKFENWLGREQQYILDFIGKETWNSIEQPYWLTSVWKQTKYKDKLILSVPMLPDAPADATLAKGANGDYDSHFVALGEHLVSMGMSGTIIRIGWEMNGNWYKWSAKDGSEANFAQYFAKIVTAMRSVEGQSFQFFWNPAIGNLSSVNTPGCYPGDAYIDYVGLDVYDESWASNTYPMPDGATEIQKLTRWQNSWNSALTREWGLNWLKSFAASHNKKIIIGEWGVNIRSDKHGGGDNPYFIQWMHDWLEANDNLVFAHIYFDVTASDGDHALSKTNTQFPLAAAKFKELWGPTASSLPPLESPYVIYDIFINNISVDFNTNTATVKGVLSDGQPKANLTIKVLDLGKTLESVNNADIINVGEITSGENGAFTYQFKMKANSNPTDAANKYSLVADGYGYVTAMETFNYSNSAFVQSALLDLMSAASSSELKNKLDAYKDNIINIPLYKDSSTITETIKNEIASKLFASKNTVFSSFNAFETAFNNEVILSTLRNVQNFTSFDNIIRGYNDILGLELDNAIFINSNIVKDEYAIYQALFNARSEFSDYNTLRTKWKQLILFNALKQGTKDTVKTTLLAFEADILAFDASAASEFAVYKSPGTSAVKTAYINSEVYNAAPSNMASLITVFKNAVNYTDPTPTTDVNSNRTGSGGGGGGSGMVAASFTADADYMPVNGILFKDIDQVSWATDSIKKLISLGVINGYGDEFRPMNNITRGEFIKIIVSALDLYDENAVTDFSDLQGHWAYEYVASAQGLEIVNGVGDNTFGVNEPICRADMAVIMHRAVLSTGKLLPIINEAKAFSDEKQTQEYAKTAISSMQKAGLINGYEDSTFRPANNATRAEVAKIIASLLDII